MNYDRRMATNKDKLPGESTADALARMMREARKNNKTAKIEYGNVTIFVDNNTGTAVGRAERMEF